MRKCNDSCYKKSWQKHGGLPLAISAVFEPNKETERRLEDAQQLPKHQFPTRYKCWQEPPEQVDASDGKTLPIPYIVPSSSQQQHRAAQ